MSEFRNTTQLQDFVHAKKLMNEYSVINFTAFVVINTAQNRWMQNTRVMITLDGFDNYGTVSILDDDIKADLFPTVLQAKFQTFEFVNNEYLNITGFHKINAAIGRYSVMITPLP